MALLGKAAMILAFDMAPEAQSDFDEWYTREHLPERLSVPGFRRGTRWSAATGPARYFALYEVEDIGTLSSPAYLERLNNPTPWTTKMMTHFRGMTRGFCTLTASAGRGVGLNALVIRFKPAEAGEAALRTWLSQEVVPQSAAQPGLTSAHLFESGLKPAPTKEQGIRGQDAGIDWVLVLTGYSAEKTGAAGMALAKQLEARGVAGAIAGAYRMDYALLAAEATQAV